MGMKRHWRDGRRRNVVVCRECGKSLGKNLGKTHATECMSCLGLFHAICLRRVRRVKNGRLGPSYWICQRCLDENRVERVPAVSPPSPTPPARAEVSS